MPGQHSRASRQARRRLQRRAWLRAPPHGFRDQLGDWLTERYGQQSTAIEQRIPSWDRQTTEGTQAAVLDVVLTYPGGRVCIDTSVTEAIDAEGAATYRRARVAGTAAREREQEKHSRYPGPGLVAAVVENRGRMGRELDAFLRAHAPADAETRAAALADVRQRMVVAVARGTAAMLLSSAGPRQRPWPSSCQGAGRGRARR